MLSRRRWLTALAVHDSKVICELPPPADDENAPWFGGAPWTPNLKSILTYLDLYGPHVLVDDDPGSLF